MTTSSCSELSREEMLAIWKRNKQNKTNKQQRPKLLRSNLSQPPTAKTSKLKGQSCSQPIGIERRTSSSIGNTPLSHFTSSTASPRKITFTNNYSATHCRPPRSSIQKTPGRGTPSHPEYRVRQLLKERNLNECSDATIEGEPEPVAFAKTKQASLQITSVRCESSIPFSNPRPTPASSVLTPSEGGHALQGITISVPSRSSSKTPPRDLLASISPLSLADFKISPTERSQICDVEAEYEKDSDSNYNIEHDLTREIQNPLTTEESPLVPTPAMNSLSHASSRPSVGDENHYGMSNETPRQVMFAFENDSVPSEEPQQRRRRGSFLLLPTPSPFNPSSLRQSSMENDTSLPSPGTHASDVCFGRLVCQTQDVHNTKYSTDESESGDRSSFQPQQYSPGDNVSRWSRERIASLAISPNSAFSKFTSSENEINKEHGKLYDNELPTVEHQFTMGRGCHESQVLSSQLQTTSEVTSSSSKTNAYQLPVSPTFAFRTVAQQKSQQVEIFSSRIGNGRPTNAIAKLFSSSNYESTENDLLHAENDRTVSENERSEDSSSTCTCDEYIFLDGEIQDLTRPIDQIKVDDRTILDSIYEGLEEMAHHLGTNQLLSKYNQLMIEKNNLHNRLTNMIKPYEQRVTPFRDVFDEKRTLEAENSELKGVTVELQKQNQMLRQEKQSVDTMVAQLQQQMMCSLKAAVENSTRLKNELAVAQCKIQDLEKELEACKSNSPHSSG